VPLPPPTHTPILSSSRDCRTSPATLDFSAMAEAARGRVEVSGYTSQAQFLVNCGITEVMSRHAGGGRRSSSPANQAKPADEPGGRWGSCSR